MKNKNKFTNRKEKCNKVCTSKVLNKQFVRKMNQDVNGKRKLFWKEVQKIKGGKVQNWKIKDRIGRLAVRKVDM